VRTPGLWDATWTARLAPRGASTKMGSFGELVCRACIATGASPAALADWDVHLTMQVLRLPCRETAS